MRCRLHGCRPSSLHALLRQPSRCSSSSASPLLCPPFDLDSSNPLPFPYPAIVLDLQPLTSSTSSTFSAHAQRIAAYLRLPLFSSTELAISNRSLPALLAPSSPPLPDRLRFILSYSSTQHLLSAHCLAPASPASAPLFISPSSVSVSFPALYTAKVLQGRFTTGSPLLSALSYAQPSPVSSTVRVPDRRESEQRQAETETPSPCVLDLTGGFGSDAFIAACHGFRVDVMETDAVLCALVHNGMERARQLPQLQPAIARLRLHHCDSLKLQPSSASRAAAAYVDSFYAPGKSSSKSKKHITFARLLAAIRADGERHEGKEKGNGEEAVLQSLIAKATQLCDRVVVKRPTRGECPVQRAAVMQQFVSRDTLYYVIDAEKYRSLQSLLAVERRTESCPSLAALQQAQAPPLGAAGAGWTAGRSGRPTIV